MGSSALVRRLRHGDVDAELVPATGLAAAVLASDLVVVEALAATETDMLANTGSRALASVGYCAEVPVWAVIGRGRCLPAALFEAMGQRLTDLREPWEAVAEVMPIALTQLDRASRRRGADRDATLPPECPMSYELLRSSAM